MLRDDDGPGLKGERVQVSPTTIPDVRLIVPRVFHDERGFFSETYSRQTLLEAAGLGADFVQDNHAASVEAGVVRGLHFQTRPCSQAKLVRAVRGSIFDVAVDIRRGSPTYGYHVSMTLSADNHVQAWIPEGFAHGYCTLEPGTEVLYKVTAYYDPASEKGLAWDDPALNIAWPIAHDAAILSHKDRTHPKLADLPAYFHY
jgi:dTDP-4-dehydrorhamnose 3,5-epimerase